MTAYVVVIIGAIGAVLSWAFVRGARWRSWTGCAIALLGAVAAVATVFEEPVEGTRHDVLILFGFVFAVAGGYVVTGAVFAQIDRAGKPARSMATAGEVLRGGAWIGALERFAVLLTLAARWPEGVAVVLAVKGLGRYPELRNADHPGAAERFIIGTLVSLGWAALCAYLVFAPYVIVR